MKLIRRVLQVGPAFRQEGKWPFFWRAWVEAAVLGFLVANLVQLFAPANSRYDLTLSFLVFVLLVGPMVETLIFQCFSLEVTASLNVRRSLRLAFSVVPFAFMHLYAGLPTVVAAGLIGGYYFALTYERWRVESLFVALAMTFLLHSGFNLVSVLGMLVFSAGP